jgi:hypothetical protein
VPQLSGFSYEWFQQSKGVIVGSTTNNSCIVNWNLSSGLDSIKIRQTNLSTGCFKDIALSVLINPLPTPVITGSVNVCTNQSGLSYTVPFVTGHSYQWFNPTLGQIMSGGNSNVITVNWGTFSGIDQLKVRQTNTLTGCYTDTTITVNVNLTPMPIISGVNTVCFNQKNVVYTVPFVSGHTYEWFNPSKGIIVSGKNSNSCSINWTINKGTDFIKVRQINSITGCYKDTSIVISINDVPQPTITGINSVCVSDYEIKYSASMIPGANYQWGAINNGIIISSTNTNELFVRWNKKAGVDTIKLTQTDVQTGCSSTQNFVVTVNPSPILNIIGPKEVCENQQQVVFRVSKNNGSSYTWKPESGNLSVQGSNGRDSVVVNFSSKGSALLRLKEMNIYGCEKDTVFTVNVNTNLQPQITTDDNKYALCKGSTKKIASSLFGDSYIWKYNGEIIQNSNSRELVINKGGSYSVEVKSKDCGGLSNEIIIVELPNPSPIISGRQTVTPQSKGVAYQVQNNTGSQYNWSISGNGNIVSTQTGSVVLLDFTDIGNVVLTVREVNSNGCIEDTSMIIAISNSTNIQESDSKTSNSIVLYPNPAEKSGVITLNYPKGNNLLSVQITDIVGRTRFQYVCDSQNSSNGSLNITPSNLNPGVYNMILYFDNKAESVSFIVK